MEIKMKKLLALVIFIGSLVGTYAESTSDAGVPLQLDLRMFTSLGVYEQDTTGEYLDQVSLFLKSVRVGFTGVLRYEFLPMLSAGLETGVAYMTYNEGRSYFTDVPLHVLGRVGFDNIFVEGHVGYYISSFADLGGVSSGVKAGVGDWFLDASVILANKTYTRYTIGYQISNLL
jgi:hypothetical protein